MDTKDELSMAEEEVDSILKAAETLISIGLQKAGRWKPLLRWPPTSPIPQHGDIMDLTSLHRRDDKGWYKVEQVMWKPIIHNRSKYTACVYSTHCIVIVKKEIYD